LSNWLDEDDRGTASPKKSAASSSCSFLRGNKSATTSGPAGIKSPLGAAASRAQDVAANGKAVARSDFDAFLDSDGDDDDDDYLNGGGGFRSSTIATTSANNSKATSKRAAVSASTPISASNEVPSVGKSDLPQRVVAAALGLPSAAAAAPSSTSNRAPPVTGVDPTAGTQPAAAAAKDSAAAAWLDDSDNEGDDDSDGLGGGGFRSNGRPPRLVGKPPSSTAAAAPTTPMRSHDSTRVPPRSNGSAQQPPSSSNVGPPFSREGVLSPKNNQTDSSANSNGISRAKPPTIKTTTTERSLSPQQANFKSNSSDSSSSTNSANSSSSSGRPTSVKGADIPSSQPSSGRAGGNERGNSSSNKGIAPPPPSTPQAGSNRLSSTSSSSSTASITSNGTSAPLSQPSPQAPRTPNHVKDTRKVQRKHQSLPENMGHAMPKTGNWAKNRYIVNNYILLDVLGAGSYAEVNEWLYLTIENVYFRNIIKSTYRYWWSHLYLSECNSNQTSPNIFHIQVRLAKDRNTDTLYAVKVIQRSLKQHKFGGGGGGATQTEEEVKREIAIMKKLNHPHVLRLFEVMDDPKVSMCTCA